MRANVEMAGKIAKMHKDNIQSGFLSSLGVVFLTMLYTFLIKHEIVIVKLDKGKVVGFAAISLNSRKMMRRFILINFFKVIYFFLYNYRKLKLLSKITETISVLFRPKSDTFSIENMPELLSIVVDERYRGAGVSSALIKEVEIMLHKKNITKYSVIVGSNLIGAIKFYSKHNFKFNKFIKVHGQLKSHQYIKEIC